MLGPILLALVLQGGCCPAPTDAPVGDDDEDRDPYDVDTGPYEAEIRWTSWGVPHVVGEDWGSVGFGLGYALSQHHGCVLADQVLRARSERALFFGAGEGDEHVNSDFGWKALGIYATAEDRWFDLPEDLQEAIVGYAAGYNRWVEEGDQPDACAGEPWVRPITHVDLLAYYLTLGEMASGGELLEYIATGEAPDRRRRPAPSGPLPDFEDLPIGSNGWAIGGDRSSTGRGMLLSNTHFPHRGERRWFEAQLTIPGEVDVYGSSLVGVPVINVGFNEHVAWTHTVSFTPRFTLYQLTIDESDPTLYEYDGEWYEMTPTDYSIEVMGDDGTVDTLTRTLWTSRFGPVLNAPVVGWTSAMAIAMRDGNQGNIEMAPTWLAMNLATDLESFQDAHRVWHGIPWVHTMMADDQGNTWYTDSGTTPNLSAEGEEAWAERLETDYFTQLVDEMGAVLLDGSDPVFDWVEEDGAREPGLVPFDDAPQLLRQDFVFNANDNHWFVNTEEFLEGYPMIYGEDRSARSPRTRMNARYLAETGAGSASGEDGLFTLDELEEAALGGRAMIEEELRDSVDELCQDTDIVSVSHGGSVVDVDITDACTVLEEWDGRLGVDSVGAVLWRETIGSGQFSWSDFTDAGELFAVGFDPNDPVDTPNTLTDPPKDGVHPVLEGLAIAVLTLEDAGFPIDTPLGEAQFQRRGDDDIPFPGGQSIEGAVQTAFYNDWGNATLWDNEQLATVVNSSTDLTDEGYLCNYGNSWVMAMQFTDDGPEARALMVYSQSEDPRSEHFDDQSLRYAEGDGLRPVLFREEDILADPELVTETISHP